MTLPSEQTLQGGLGHLVAATVVYALMAPVASAAAPLAALIIVSRPRTAREVMFAGAAAGFSVWWLLQPGDLPVIQELKQETDAIGRDVLAVAVTEMPPGILAGAGQLGFARPGLGHILVQVALDFSGRAHLSWGLTLPAERVGDFDAELALEFFRAFAHNAKVALHITQQAGDNTHHILESAFKSFGRALDQATRIDARRTGVPSTKGTLT